MKWTTLSLEKNCTDWKREKWLVSSPLPDHKDMHINLKLQVGCCFFGGGGRDRELKYDFLLLLKQRWYNIYAHVSCSSSNNSHG